MTTKKKNTPVADNAVVDAEMPVAEESRDVSAASVEQQRKIGITETILRDAHQSLMATRMSTEDMTPVMDAMDEVGYHSVEVWGGATFDSCMRFLDEDPWERLRIMKKHFKRQSCKCFSADRILSVTAIMPTIRPASL